MRMIGDFGSMCNNPIFMIIVILYEANLSFILMRMKRNGRDDPR